MTATAIAATAILLYVFSGGEETSRRQVDSTPTTSATNRAAVRPPPLADQRGSVTEQPREAPQPVEAAEVQAIIDKLQQPYPSADAKASSLLSALRASGSPPQELAEGGASLGKLLSQQQLVGDWNCFRGGCYFAITKDKDSLNYDLVGAREKTIPGYVMVITPEAPPNKLMILLNYKQG